MQRELQLKGISHKKEMDDIQKELDLAKHKLKRAEYSKQAIEKQIYEIVEGPRLERERKEKEAQEAKEREEAERREME